MVILLGLGVVLNLQGDRVKSVLRDVLAPVQEMVSSGASRVRESFLAVRNVGDMVDENSRLEAKLIQLGNEVLALTALEKENLQLREQLLYRERSTWDLVPCEVIARDVSGWWQTLRLGKGYLDSVETGMAVMTPDGLVGKTIECTPRTADVLLLSDPSCRVSVQIGRTGTFGILSGEGVPMRGRVTCVMEFINKSATLRPGDEVVTSGLGGVFPKGLVVGHVDTVDLDPSGLSQRARVAVRSPLGGITHVYVVVQEPDPVESLLIQRAQENEERSR